MRSCHKLCNCIQRLAQQYDSLLQKKKYRAGRKSWPFQTESLLHFKCFTLWNGLSTKWAKTRFIWSASISAVSFNTHAKLLMWNSFVFLAILFCFRLPLGGRPWSLWTRVSQVSSLQMWSKHKLVRWPPPPLCWKIGQKEKRPPPPMDRMLMQMFASALGDS